MKRVAVTVLALIQLILAGHLMGQINPDSVEYMPENERSAALLSLAKANYTSQFDLADEYSYKALLVAEKLGQKDELGLANKYLGITDYFRRNYDSALKHYQKALRQFEGTHNKKEEANVINNIAIIYSEQGIYDTAISYYQKSLEIREEMNDANGIIGSLNNIGNLYQGQGNDEKALEYFRKAMDISQLVFPEKKFPTLLSSMAKSYSEIGEVAEAVTYYQKGIEASKMNNDVRSEINSRTNLGNLYIDLGSTDQAISYLSEALDLAQNSQLEYVEGVIKLNIGNVYFQMENFSQAAKYYNSALLVYQNTNDLEGQINGLINVALTEEKLNLSDSAQARFLQAREIAEQINKPNLLAMTANYLGKNHLQNGDFKLADYWLKEALRVSETNDIEREYYMANYNLGLYWFEQNNYEKSIGVFKKALQKANKMQSVILQKDAAESLWQAYQKVNQFEQALETLHLFNALNDSIFNEEKQKQVMALEGKLNLKMKENQIAGQAQLIAQQKEILKQEKNNKIFIVIVAVLAIGLLIIFYSREQIRRQKEKAVLIQQNLTTERDLLQLQMNPHFIFNALNSIQSFISENNSFEAEMFLSKFARLMRYYLDSSSKRWVDFNDEIQAIELNLELEKLRLNNQFEFKTVVDASVEPDEIQIPPMLLQPFIENAIKHGLRPKKSDGMLELGFKQGKDYLFCYVEDNGVGREAAAQLKGKKPEHESKGVELTRGRLSALSPKNNDRKILSIIDLKDKSGIAKGTRVELFVPFRYF